MISLFMLWKKFRFQTHSLFVDPLYTYFMSPDVFMKYEMMIGFCYNRSIRKL